MFAAFAAVSLVKRVTVVDADIDPWDATAVDWARMNRMKLERDLLLVPHAGTDRSEPMESGGLVTKAGYDATAKTGDRVEGIDRALPPAAQRAAATEMVRGDRASRAQALARSRTPNYAITAGRSARPRSERATNKKHALTPSGTASASLPRLCAGPARRSRSGRNDKPSLHSRGVGVFAGEKLE